MKKSTVIVIAVIYFVSIAVVGFFGLEISSYNPVVYITQINITNTELVTRPDNTFYMLFDYTEGLTVPLTFEALPENATERNAVKVEIYYQSDTDVAEFISGNILFYKPGMVSVRIYSTDGRNVTVRCDVYAQMPDQQMITFTNASLLGVK